MNDVFQALTRDQKKHDQRNKYHQLRQDTEIRTELREINPIDSREIEKQE